MQDRINGSSNSSVLDPAILGKISLLQTTLHAIPNSASLVEFLCRGLEIIPGTSFVAVRINEHVKFSREKYKDVNFEENFCGVCDKFYSGRNDTGIFNPGKHNQKFFRICIQTINANYGCIILEKSDDKEFEPYQNFLENLANTAALVIELNHHEQALKSLNDKLQRSKEELELLVGERTKELTTANQELKKSNQEIIFAQRATLKLMEDLQTEVDVRKRAEQKILKANRIYNVISQINQTIVRVRERSVILEEACRIAVEHAQFSFAWIRLWDEKTKLFAPFTFAGKENGYLSANINFTVNEIPDELSHLRIVFHEGKHRIINDIQNDPVSAVWKEEALKCGFASAIILPIKLFGKVVGAFNLFASSTNFFDDEETELLDQVTNDISFALGALELEKRREHAEDALRAKTAELDTFFDTSLDLLCIADIDGIFHRLNPEWGNTLGYEVSSLIGKNFTELVHPDDIAATQSAVSDLANQKMVIDFTNRYRCFDGSYRWIEWRSTPAGKFIYAAARDITERKRSEKELIAAKEKAEESDNLKSEFLAQVSHEIRTPIHIIASNVEYLNDAAGPKADADTIDSLEAIDLASKRIIRTIDLILNFSEVQVGGYELVISDVNLDKSILKKLYTEHIFSAKKKKLDFKYECKIDDPVVPADEHSMVQIFANLIDNAIKYTKSGNIVITLDRNRNSELTVVIKDTGIGMSPEFLPKLFEPFMQEERGFTRSYDGNGLGLALVKRYCDLNGAEIKVESIKNSGTVFTVTFKNKFKHGD